MKKLSLITLVFLFYSQIFADEGKPLQEPEPKYAEEIEKQEAKTLSKQELKKRKKQKAPRKVFPPSKKTQNNPGEEMSTDEQIKAADRSDLE